MANEMSIGRLGTSDATNGLDISIEDIVATPHNPAAPKPKDTTTASQGVAKRPSMAAVMARKPNATAANNTQFAEETGRLFADEALSGATPIRAAFQNLGDKTPQERAQAGSKLGTITGMGAAGPIGSIIGAGVGAMVGRSVGMIQSGEQESQVRRATGIDTMKTMGIIGDNNRIQFDTTTSLLATPDTAARLQNLSPVTGQPDRSLFEIDKSNPLSNRTSKVARVFARVLNDGVMGFTNDKNPQDDASLNAFTGFFANMLQGDAESIDEVYDRARQLARKFNIDQTKMRTFFDANKTRISKEEAASLREGIDTIYA